MKKEEIHQLDELKDRLEDVMIYSLDVRDSLRVFEYSAEHVKIHSNLNMDAILRIYVILLDVLADKRVRVMNEAELLTKEIKSNAAS